MPLPLLHPASLRARRRAPRIGIASFVLVCCLAAGPAAARFAKTVLIKGTPDEAGRLFDPHNHWNGVLPYRALGAVSKKGQQQIGSFLASPPGQQLKQLLGTEEDADAEARIREYMAYHTLTLGARTLSKEEIMERAELYQLLSLIEGQVLLGTWQEMQLNKHRLVSDEARMANGTQTLAKILACEPGDDVRATKHLLQQALTSTPQIDFDTAYVARSLVELPFLDQVQATLDTLAHDQIGYVEMSHPISKFTPQGLLAPAVLELLARAEATGGTQLRWLPMLLTGMLADDGSGHTVVLEKQSGQCQATGPSPASQLVPLQVDAQGKSLLERVLEHPQVVGFDMASPERSCFTRLGAEHFIEALTIAYRVARSQKRRLVAHVHVGEGFPAYASDSVSCDRPKAPKDLEPLPVRYRDGVPVHFINAEDNIEVLLAAIAAFRDKLKDEVARFDDHIVIRFGHATHANLSQANRMRELRIWADVNLTSNLATGALTLDGESSPEALRAAVQRPLPPGDLKRLALDPRSARLFRHHSLVTLLEAGVQVILGTDGGGVEHSSMPREYMLAGAILDQAIRDIEAGSFESTISDRRRVKLSKGPIELSAETLAWLHRALSVSILYRNQRAHYEFISASPGSRRTPRVSEEAGPRKLWEQLHKP